MERSKKYIVLLNGPPGCGKDTIASHLVHYLAFHKLKFAAPIKRMAAGLFNISEESIERLKDLPLSLLREETTVGDLDSGTERRKYGEPDTLRQLLINLSEQFLKPAYGLSFFGRIAAREVKGSSYSLAIFTDSGFSEEALCLVREFGRENTILIRLQRDGCNFDGDSRSYLHGICQHEYDVDNSGLLSHSVGRVARLISKTFNTQLLKEIELYDDR